MGNLSAWHAKSSATNCSLLLGNAAEEAVSSTDSPPPPPPVFFSPISFASEMALCGGMERCPVFCEFRKRKLA